MNFTICGYKIERVSFYTHIKTIFYVLSLCFGDFFTFFNSIPIKELILNYFGVFLLYLVIYTQNTFSNAYFADL